MEAIPECKYQIEKNPGPEHVGTIAVNTKFVRPDDQDSNISISLPTNEFTEVEDSPHKEKLYYFLKDLGVDARDALHLIQELTLLACKVTSSFDYRPQYALLIRLTLTLTLHAAPSSTEGPVLLDESQVEPVLDDPQVDESFVDDPQLDKSFINDPQVDESFIDDYDQVEFLDDCLVDESVIDDSQLEEVIQASLEEDDERRNIEFRHERKLRVGALSRRIYKKSKRKTSIISNQCTRNKRKQKTLSSDNDDMCTICLMEFKDGRKVATLLCGHEFHNTCIMKWIKFGDNCPLCRVEIAREDEEIHQLRNTVF
ncbi:PREDICTED: E3 ubiquitin ligase BIG BROTHER-related-like [Camelina sativa]|uniref:RING-type E3 ubiquitin transferase n=1 Tax=Camelina sativa TaxID=90675 RepID=A0ABM0WPN1_CAMSA|nr:PREDICTED: E3 ubiquitin ligase BIG BROTHER-related-like [Camelina sativa]